jgi:hypothetical protein
MAIRVIRATTACWRRRSSEGDIAMTALTPFADDAASVAIDKLTIENGTTQISLYGSLDITRDKVGLQHALALKALIDQAVQVLTSDPALPPRLKLPRFRGVFDGFVDYGSVVTTSIMASYAIGER